jgi:REP element-mobilizing transposase RayT
VTRPLRILIPGGFYHVTCRGNDRRAIFGDDGDRSLFLEKLRGSLANYQVDCHAYVLMGNHFHLLVSTPKSNLSEFMRHFNISYTAAFNRRHGRVGHLYQGRYKAILVDQDSYLLELSRYVHLNPIRIKSYRGSGVGERIRYLERYSWSSLAGYLKSANKQPWVHYDMVLGQVGGSRKKYGEFITDGIAHGYDTPWDRITGQVVLGQERFVDTIKNKLAAGRTMREQPAARAFAARGAVEIVREVCKRFGVKENEITGKRSGLHRDKRAVAMEMLYRHGQLSQAAIGKILGGLDYTTVSRERKRLRDSAQQDKRLGAAMREIEEQLRHK